ncbi:MAG: Cytidine deaminase [Bacteroidia bacterium]|nr:Cytidine deaminase [Bacteroidia bacterium]
MKKLSLTIDYLEYENMDELIAEDKNLMQQAHEAGKSAYAPYSNFSVGAAVLLENGVVVKGSNQENAAYPTGLCAERVAVFSAGTNYPGVAIKTIAITAKSSRIKVESPVTPCGDCRQAISEYEVLYNKPIRFLLMGETGKVLELKNVGSLLPLRFEGKNAFHSH